MGITIFARGNIDRLEEIPHLIEQLKVVAQNHGWTYSVLDDDFEIKTSARLVGPTAGKPAVVKGPLGLKGIILSIDPKCESLAILFDRFGALTNVMQHLFRSSNDARQSLFTACKTQSGCIDSHIHIVELLHALKKEFISDLSVNDEGEYWESGDVERLANKHAVLEHYLDHTMAVISGIKASENASAASLASQIEQALLDAKKDVVH